MTYDVSKVARYRIRNGRRVALSEAERQAIAEDRTAMEAERAAVAYRHARRREYPPIGDQLDVLWRQLEAERAAGRALDPAADAMLDQVQAVKARHPKPGGG